jgi:antitoxin HicB
MSEPGYHIEVRALSIEEGGGYLASVPDLPGCMSDGATPDEARAHARAAISEWLAAAKAMGRAAPKPSYVPA